MTNHSFTFIFIFCFILTFVFGSTSHCFQILSEAATNICKQGFVEHKISIHCGKYLSVQIVGHVRSPQITWWETAKLSSKVTALFTLPQLINEWWFLWLQIITSIWYYQFLTLMEIISETINYLNFDYLRMLQFLSHFWRTV